jgi:hypothetical protein
MAIHRRLLIIAATSTLALLPSTRAHASIGAAIGARAITLERTAQPGRTYQLPAAYVENSGTEPARYHLHVERLSTGTGHTVPRTWVIPARNDFLLAPHKSVYVPLKLELPSGAAAGRYLSDVVAAAGPPRAVRGTTLGAAAATKLIFHVADPGFALPGWVIDALISLAAAGLIAFAIQRSGIRIRFEHGAAS